MSSSTRLPTDRLAIGQLLVRLLREFRREMLAPAADAGYGDLRIPHLQITGNVGVDGVRLTELASRAQLSLATTSELVNDLQALGYLERRPDPIDRRAKLIYPTDRGRQMLEDAGQRVAQIERTWASLVGRTAFNDATRTLDRLLTALSPPPEED